MPDIIVVGAGPAGTTAAHALARAGLVVLVLEEHASAGLPVHCTGIVGEALFTTFDLPRSLVRETLSRFRVFAPSQERYFDLEARPGTSSAAYVLDRAALDRTLAERAAEAGVRFLYGARVREVTSETEEVRVRAEIGGAQTMLRARLCLLACGAMSNLPARSGIVPPQTYHRTVQATYALPDVRDAEIHLGHAVAPGSFGYAVSLGDGTAKIGVINRLEARSGFRALVERSLGGRLGPRVSREVYRRIPMGAARRSVAGRVLAVGDAAGQAKTTTGGGIYYAMQCAQTLAETVLEARKGRDFRLPWLARYEHRWRQHLGFELRAGLWMRRLLEHVSDDEVSRLVAAVDSAAARALIDRDWRFDYHRRLLLTLARMPEVREPLWSALLRGAVSGGRGRSAETRCAVPLVGRPS